MISSRRNGVLLTVSTALLLVFAAASLSVPPPLQAQSEALVLHVGWTNVTYDGEILPVDQALGAAAGAIEVIWRWDAVDQAWSGWIPSIPALSALTTLATGDVLWVRASLAIDWIPSRGVLFERARIRVNDAQTIDVEIADTASRRSRGLMFRQSLPAEEGMIFLFAADSSGGFWMKDTFVPLSIAYIDSAGVIITIRDMEPLSTAIVSPSGPYRWALEMNQGWFAASGVEVGDSVRFTGQ
jgi:uncharacterized membrane protein (UPF0127 family)